MMRCRRHEPPGQFIVIDHGARVISHEAPAERVGDSSLLPRDVTLDALSRGFPTGGSQVFTAHGIRCCPVTAIRDRRGDAESAEKDTAALSWNERSVINSRRGVPWWGAVLLAFGLALIGAFVDQLATDGLSLIFHVCYVVGALGAVLAVQRKSLFGPMVQPPLAMALAVPLIVLTASGLPEGSDMLSKALAIGTPLINSFPVMAGTTAATVLVGILRLVKQRDPEARTKSGRDKTDSEKAESGKAEPGKNRAGKEAAAVAGEDVDDRTRPTMSAARPDSAGEARPRRRVPGTAGARSKAAPPPERSARPRGGPAAPPPRRQRPDADQPRKPREGNPPPRRRATPPPADQVDKQRRGEGRQEPPARRGRRVPPPPRGEEPPRGEQPPRGRQPGAGPRRGAPRSEPPRGGRPRGDHPPRRGRPWDDDRT